jgi:hypothetical protein
LSDDKVLHFAKCVKTFKLPDVKKAGTVESEEEETIIEESD